MKATKLPSGNYRVQLRFGEDENGKRMSKSFTAATEWEALKLAEEYKNCKNMPNKITVREALNNYIEAKRNVIAPATLHGYESIAKNRMKSLQNRIITELTKIDIQRAINFEAERGLGYKSIKSAYDLIRSSSKLFDVELPSIKQFTLPPKSVKTEDLPDLDKLLNIIIGSSVELPCMLAVWCGGMRMSEIRGLQFRDICDNQNGRFIKVRRAKVCINGHDVLSDRNKTYLSTRDIPLSDYIYNLIKAIPHSSDTDFIINENYGAIKRRYDRLLKKHGIKMTFHELRAQFATTMNLLGVEKEVLQSLGGWSNSKVLDEVYIRTPKKRIINCMKTFDTYMYAIINNRTDASNALTKEDNLSHECHTK